MERERKGSPINCKGWVMVGREDFEKSITKVGGENWGNSWFLRNVLVFFKVGLQTKYQKIKDLCE